MQAKDKNILDMTVTRKKMVSEYMPLYVKWVQDSLIFFFQDGLVNKILIWIHQSFKGTNLLSALYECESIKHV